MTIKKANKASGIALLAAVLSMFANCTQPNGNTASVSSSTPVKNEQPTSDKYTPYEQKLLDFGLLDIQTMDSSIAVHLVYSTPYNFLGKRLYHDISHAFMLPAMAEKLVKAQKLLKSIRPDLSLLIYDAARPLSIQREMWDLVKGTPNSSFVANPANGRGMHNYGAAVDITLMDCTRHPLPMGSEYDYFGAEARIDNETELLSNGRITNRELENRKLLRRVMTESGFTTCVSEWWHFNLMPTARAKNELKVIDF